MSETGFFSGPYAGIPLNALKLNFRRDECPRFDAPGFDTESCSETIKFYHEYEPSTNVDEKRLKTLGEALNRFNQMSWNMNKGDVSIGDEIIVQHFKALSARVAKRDLNITYQGHRISQEILAFIRETNSLMPFKETLQLVQDCFGPLKDINFRLEQDPEVEGVSWIVIDIKTPLGEEQLLKAYDIFTEKFVSKIANEIGELFRISF